ncbi:hypothetical protein [Streptomyces sp. 891-h]|nr:hypothetical protein [Streptomyces sp. 891-h]
MSVDVRRRPLSPDSQPLPDVPEGRPLHVLAEGDGDGKIGATQNSQVKSD